jgi:uncharacterized protein (DUF58 family)
MDAGYEDDLRIAARKHDLVAVHLYDPREAELPPVGLMRAVDAESGGAAWVDTSDRRVREGYARWWREQYSGRLRLFRNSGVDLISLRTDQPYVRPLMAFFHARERRW